MLIDTTKEEFKNYPPLLNGQVILDTFSDNKGNYAGYVAVDIATAKTLQTKTDDELEKMGYLKYKEIINQID